MRRRSICGIAIAVSALGAATANAQSASDAPSGVAGVVSVAPPPAGFDALHAAPEARRRFAVPPAPDARIAATAYQRWRAAVAAPRRVATPVLERTEIYNGPDRRVGATTRHSNGTDTFTSSNWSGTSIVGGTFAQEQAIIGEFVVPTARQAFGICTGAWDYAALWPGIDGNGSNDVLQAGAEVDAYCSLGVTGSFYSAWVEWYPFPEVRVSAPTLNPGDLVFIEVWSSSPTSGYAYFYDYSTQEAAQYHLTAPYGTALQGSSVEWIVERPGLQNGLATLTNYIDSAWSYGTAWNFASSNPTFYFQALTPPVGTLEIITMLDDNNAAISTPKLENGDFLWFQDYGSACGANGGPPC
jgi:hypothetical protein